MIFSILKIQLKKAKYGKCKRNFFSQKINTPSQKKKRMKADSKRCIKADFKLTHI